MTVAECEYLAGQLADREENWAGLWYLARGLPLCGAAVIWIEVPRGALAAPSGNDRCPAVLTGDGTRRPPGSELLRPYALIEDESELPRR